MSVQKRGAPPQIALVDFNSGADGDLHAVAAALQKQAQEHFALAPPYGWGLSATVRVAAGPKDITSDEWVLGLYSHPDVAKALGYHDRKSNTPFMKVFSKLDMQDGVPWSTTASHEMLETLLDPELSRCVQAPSGHFWALEVCDFVEADTYLIDGVAVSNFNLPPAFEPPTDGTAAANYDWLGLSTTPFEVRPGGYGSYWSGTDWVQVTAVHHSKREGRTTLDLLGMTRCMQRYRQYARAHFGDPHYRW